MKPVIVLASQSPRRREILRSAGIPHVVRPAEIDETPLPGEAAAAYVRRLAATKALAAPCTSGEIVLGADTVVVVDGEILGKPKDDLDAARMLRMLAGRMHIVLTGICLRRDGSLWVEAEETLVRFVPLTETDISEYVRSGESLDKAGAYGIQGLASKFIDRVEGCYLNVVGLPVALLWKGLSRPSLMADATIALMRRANPRPGPEP